MAIPFLFVFVAGIAADLLESRYRAPVFACLAGLVFANAIWNIWALVQAGPRLEGNPPACHTQAGVF